MDVWEQIRLRCVRNGEPVKLVARELGIPKNTVKKYIQSQNVPVTKPLDRRSAVDAHKTFIDDLLRDRRRSPRSASVCCCGSALMHL